MVELILELIRGHHHYQSFGIWIAACYIGNCIHLNLSTAVFFLINQQLMLLIIIE